MKNKQLHLPAVKNVSGTVKVPGSKSISNRALLLSALCSSPTEIHNLLVSDDTKHMMNALTVLGVKIERIGDTFVVHGCGNNFPNKQAELFLGNAGTAFRPLAAVLALTGGFYHLKGVNRMHERPIGDLVDTLNQIGCDIDYIGNNGYPPLKIRPSFEINTAKHIEVKGNVSSQYLSALLMALPLIGQEVTIDVTGGLISKPYIDVTLSVMRDFGVGVDNQNHMRYVIPAGSYYSSLSSYYIEPDASSASYFYAAGAIAAKDLINIDVGFMGHYVQGDWQFISAAKEMGARIEFAHLCHRSRLNAIELDCNHIPDAAMTLAVMALFAEGTTKLTNIASWRVKETDRIAAMATELAKLGAEVRAGRDFIEITPPEKLIPNVEIDTYDDHRMAMCFSLVSLGDKGVPVTINDPHCVAKTFPNYFETFKSIAVADDGSSNN